MRSPDPSLIARARDLAADVLGDELQLREHSARAAGRAQEFTSRLRTAEPAEVIAAAWLHDIGYAPALVRTGFHPLDGALFLMKGGWPDRVIRLVAHHSHSAMEAPFYGVGHHLGVIEPVTGVDADILASADLTSGHGSPTPSVDDRLQAMRATAEASELVPDDVIEARQAALLLSYERVIGRI